MEEIVTKSLFQAVAGGGISGLLVAGIILMIVHQWIKSITQDKADLVKRISELETKTIQDLSDTLEEHVKSDKSQSYDGSLYAINAQLSKIADKMDKLLESSARHDAEIKANKDFINNLDKSFQTHKGIKHVA